MTDKEPVFVDRVLYTPKELYHKGILLDAAESTQDHFPGVDGEAISNRLRIDAILGSPDVTKPDAPYQDRIHVMGRMLEMIHEEWRSDIVSLGCTKDRAYISVLYKGGVGWELLVDMVEPNNIFAFRADYSLQVQDTMAGLIERHKKGEDIFGEDGLEFLLPCYKDWKLPIIGVKKLYGFDFYKKYIFSRGKTEVEESAVDGLFIGDRQLVFGFDDKGRVIDHSKK